MGIAFHKNMPALQTSSRPEGSSSCKLAIIYCFNCVEAAVVFRVGGIVLLFALFFSRRVSSQSRSNSNSNIVLSAKGIAHHCRCANV